MQKEMEEITELATLYEKRSVIDGKSGGAHSYGNYMCFVHAETNEDRGPQYYEKVEV